jgi:LemA protein
VRRQWKPAGWATRLPPRAAYLGPGQFKIAVENYPDLKANQNFLALQEELTSTENKISFSRQNYNDQVLFFNNKTEVFPSNIIAGMFGFKKEEFFEIQDAEERKVPKVSF